MVDCWYSIELNLSYCCVKLNGPLCIQKLNFLMASSEISWFKLSCTDHWPLTNTWRSWPWARGWRPRRTPSWCSCAAGRRTRSTCGSHPPQWPCIVRRTLLCWWWGRGPRWRPSRSPRPQSEPVWVQHRFSHRRTGCWRWWCLFGSCYFNFSLFAIFSKMHQCIEPSRHFVFYDIFCSSKF